MEKKYISVSSLDNTAYQIPTVYVQKWWAVWGIYMHSLTGLLNTHTYAYTQIVFCLTVNSLAHRGISI